MKVRITQPGFENYTGQMGMELFSDGLSVNDLSERIALRFSSLFLCEWEDGSEIVFTAVEEEPCAPVGRETYLAEAQENEVVGGHDGEPIPMEKVNIVSDIPAEVVKRYTRVELEKIADQKGIAGLREIAKPLGITGTSINGLIDSILEVAGAEQNLPEGVERV